MQTKEFYSENSNTAKIETIKINEKIKDEYIETLDEQINNKRNEINKTREDIRTRIDKELKVNLDRYKWPWWQLFLWLIFGIPGAVHEAWRREKINNLKTAAYAEYVEKIKLDTEINRMYGEKEKLELKRVDLPGLPINFIIERQLAFLQANEIFFKNMILKSNDPKFLKQMKNKSINTFLRENHNLVNSIEKYKLEDSSSSINVDDSSTIAYKKNIPTDSLGDPLPGGMGNTRRIKINSKNCFTKRGKLFLDFVSSKNNEKYTEEYRGNLDKENSSKQRQKTPLIDTASHGCIMKAFDNFLGLNVLVDTKLIVTPDDYDVFMKSAKGKNAGDIFWDEVFDTDERQSAFIKGDITENRNYKTTKQDRLNELEKNPLSPELQDAIMKINFLDYLCSNRDRHTTNLFVWKNGLDGIDNEWAFFTGKDWKEEAWTLCIKEDLPNLIPYATKELYEIVKSLIDDKNIDKLIDIYMIFAKIANEKNLLQGAKNIRTRARELYEHFKWLEKEGRILESVENFNSKTAREITEKSLIFNEEKQRYLNKDLVVGIATGMGSIGYINREIKNIKGPQPKQEKNLSIIFEEDEKLEDDKDDIW